MKNTTYLLRVIHRVTLGTLLLLIAIMPLIIDIDIVATLVILPTFLIIILGLSIIIEQKLNTLALSKPVIQKKKRCLIINCIRKTCLG
ncbi:hypothetical protein L3081_20490 [Colwellia sp. MSW7]|uniref:Uncharacterized protein n=1 Tax=Colwellia maritima TaxID=2912588 RepID=A0ABS9X516_9GAMM|nr:hypothetical protein [Colwellia maritima]MCI2285328.1 hypothetical protein [Colwellia maritima]